MTGKAFTVTLEIAVFEETQPLASVPVTAYVVFVDGDTIKEPPLTVDVTTPVGIIVKLLPEQIWPLLTPITGKAFTVTLDTAVLEDKQPNELVPATVYVVLDVGETTNDPPCTVYVLAPLGTIVKDEPEQKAPLFTLTVGKA